MIRTGPVDERSVHKVYEVFSCRNGEWIMAGSTPDRSDAERLFLESLKEKTCQGARLVEEAMDPNTGDIRDRVIQKRDKQDNLPYFNPRKASEAAAAKRARARAAAEGGFDPGRPERPGPTGAMAQSGSSPVSAAAVREIAAEAAFDTSTGLMRWLVMNMIAIGVPTSIFIAHERFFAAVQTELMLGVCLILMVVLLVVLNRDALTAERRPPRPTAVPEHLRPSPPPRRKRMKVIGVLDREQAKSDKADTEQSTDARPETLEEAQRNLLQLLEQSLRILAGDGRFVQGGRLNRLDMFGCHLFLAGAVETALPDDDRKAEESLLALRSVLTVLGSDSQMIDWFIGGLDRHRADEKSAAMLERGRVAGNLWREKNKGAAGKLLEALVAWNAPDPDGIPTVTLLSAVLPHDGSAPRDGGRLAIARARGAMASHGGRELQNADNSIVATFVSPRDAIAAAVDMQVGNEADRALDGTVPQLRIAVHGHAELSKGGEAAMKEAVQVVTMLASTLATGTVVLSGPVARAINGLYGTESLGSAGIGGGIEVFALGSVAPAAVTELDQENTGTPDPAADGETPAEAALAAPEDQDAPPLIEAEIDWDALDMPAADDAKPAKQEEPVT